MCCICGCVVDCQLRVKAVASLSGVEEGAGVGDSLAATGEDDWD